MEAGAAAASPLRPATPRRMVESIHLAAPLPPSRTATARIVAGTRRRSRASHRACPRPRSPPPRRPPRAQSAELRLDHRRASSAARSSRFVRPLMRLLHLGQASPRRLNHSMNYAFWRSMACCREGWPARYSSRPHTHARKNPVAQSETMISPPSICTIWTRYQFIDRGSSAKFMSSAPDTTEEVLPAR